MFQRCGDQLHGAVQRRQQPGPEETRDPAAGARQARARARPPGAAPPRDRVQPAVPGAAILELPTGLREVG